MYKKDDFITSLDAHDWEDIYKASGPSPKWDIFKRTFISCSDKHAPYKDMNITENKSHWLTNDLLELMNTRDALFKKAKRTKSSQDWTNAKNARILVNRAIINAKRDYISDILNRDDKNRKGIWKNIQQFLPNKKSNSSIPKIKNNQGVITKKSDEISHTLNAFFGSIGKNLAEKINLQIDKDNNLPPVAEALTNIDQTTAEKVKKLIDDLSTYKSMGINGFSIKLVKDSAQTIAPILAHIINSCIESCSIPKEWKHAKITTIYKEGCKTSPSNYRPISVLPFISKLIEKVLHQSL